MACLLANELSRITRGICTQWTLLVMCPYQPDNASEIVCAIWSLSLIACKSAIAEAIGVNKELSVSTNPGTQWNPRLNLAVTGRTETPTGSAK